MAAIERMQYATEFEMEKVKTTIKQFYRDWSVEVRVGRIHHGKGRGRDGIRAFLSPASCQTNTLMFGTLV